LLVSLGVREAGGGRALSSLLKADLVALVEEKAASNFV
jgi:hypothetical protein